MYVGSCLRAGTATQRLHVTRTHELWIRRPVTTPKRLRPEPAAVRALETFDRAEDRRLRAWLRDNVHLLLALGDETVAQ